MLSYDLHCHSTCSDGGLEVAELIDRACACGVQVLALTDHDTVQGVEQAAACAAGRLVLVPGIEVSVTWRSEQIHVAGLFVDPRCPQLQELIASQRERRRHRAEAIGRRLERLGFADALQRTAAFAGEGAVITRGTYASYLHHIGAAASADQAFNSYLRRGRGAYVSTTWVSLAECVEALHAAGGLAVVAHPGRYRITAARLRQLLAEFRACGGDGMEVSMCAQPPGERSYLASLAVRHELYASAGSDFHRPGPLRELGRDLGLPEGVTPVWEQPQAAAWLTEHMPAAASGTQRS